MIKIAFTNGCFDLLHAGHVQFLQKCATLCDELHIFLNEDVSVARLKGTGRPIAPLEQRRTMVLAVVPTAVLRGFQEDNPLNRMIQCGVTPDLYIKGGDLNLKSPEVEWFMQQGVPVVLVPRTLDISTSRIIGKIKNG
jgi:rfaE bifunctional protein nucleotidyltransferase chain/domain